jgi:ATP-binding cassette, subfamily B, multidrug efflux pump
MLFTMGGLMLLLAVLGFGSSLICQYYAARTSQGFGTTLRNTIFSHITTLTYSDLDQLGTSSMVNRITSDVNQLQLAVAMLIRLVIRAPFICIGAIAMSMFLDLKLSLIFLAIAPLFVFTIYLIINKTCTTLQPLSKKARQNHFYSARNFFWYPNYTGIFTYRFCKSTVSACER